MSRQVQSLLKPVGKLIKLLKNIPFDCWTICFLIFNAVLALPAGAAGGIEDKRNDTARFVIERDTVFDRSTGLIWQRCSVGQHWDLEIGCVGLPKKVWFYEALDLESNGWRLPSTLELKSIIPTDKRHIIDSLAFPDAPATWYWAKDEKGAAAAWGPTCMDDINDSCYQNNSRAIRLVRPAPPPASFVAH